LAAAAVVARDPTGDDEQFLSAYQSHCQIVAATIRRTYRLSREDEEDLAQVLGMKLLTIPSSSRRKGAQFIKTCINNAARDELRRLLRYEHRYLPSVIDGLAFSEVEAPDTGHRVEDLLSCLNALQRSIITAHLGLDGPATPLRAIAKALGITVTVAQAELDAALGLMRDANSTK
jgi:hypothetical protein